jgi:hypothetical protein
MPESRDKPFAHGIGPLQRPPDKGHNLPVMSRFLETQLLLQMSQVLKRRRAAAVARSACRTHALTAPARAPIRSEARRVARGQPR